MGGNPSCGDPIAGSGLDRAHTPRRRPCLASGVPAVPGERRVARSGCPLRNSLRRRVFQKGAGHRLRCLAGRSVAHRGVFRDRCEIFHRHSYRAGSGRMRRRAHLVAGIAHDLRCGVGVGVAAVGENDVLADDRRDGLAGLTGPETTTTLPCLTFRPSSATPRDNARHVLRSVKRRDRCLEGPQ